MAAIVSLPFHRFQFVSFAFLPQFGLWAMETPSQMLPRLWASLLHPELGGGIAEPTHSHAQQQREQASQGAQGPPAEASAGDGPSPRHASGEEAAVAEMESPGGEAGGALSERERFMQAWSGFMESRGLDSKVASGLLSLNRPRLQLCWEECAVL
jgi:hypothetical protein